MKPYIDIELAMIVLCGWAFIGGVLSLILTDVRALVLAVPLGLAIIVGLVGFTYELVVQLYERVVYELT